MTASEIEDYLSILGANDAQRVTLLQEILDHAADDGMSAADFLLARKALATVQARIGTPAERKGRVFTTIQPEPDEQVEWEM